MQPPTHYAQIVEANLPRGQRDLHAWIGARIGPDGKPLTSWGRIADELCTATGRYVTRPTVQVWWERMESDRAQAALAAEDPQ